MTGQPDEDCQSPTCSSDSSEGEAPLQSIYAHVHITSISDILKIDSTLCTSSVQHLAEMVINLAHNTDNNDLFPPGQEEEDREQGWWRPSDSDLSEGLSFCLFTFHVAKMSVGCLDSAQP